MSYLGAAPNPVALDPLTASLSSKYDKTGYNFTGAYRNKIINGDFDFWQRGTTQSVFGYGSADRWLSGPLGSTNVMSRQAFTAGQTDVPGEPTFFCRNVVTSVASASNLVRTEQRIEDVRTLAGKTATLTFYAKADAPRPMSTSLVQSFGTAGSASIATIGVNKVTLQTTWQKFSYSFVVPSIAGKTLATDGTHYLGVRFWFDAGSSQDALTNFLGQQSGTFDIAHVSLVEGDATGETEPFEQRHNAQELALCLRYYQNLPTVWRWDAAADNGTIGHTMYFPVIMRIAPSASILSNLSSGFTNFSISETNINYAICLMITTATGVAARTFRMTLGLDAEL
jgi:hypothetical protein